MVKSKKRLLAERRISAAKAQVKRLEKELKTSMANTRDIKKDIGETKSFISAQTKLLPKL